MQSTGALSAVREAGGQTEVVGPRPVDVADRVVGRVGLTPRMRVATRALAEALFADDQGAPPAARLDWLTGDLDHFIAHAGPRARLIFRLCLWAISALSPLLIFRLPPLRRLPLPVRARALERMEESFLGMALFGAKALICVVYYEHPDAARAIGYDGSCMVEAEQ